MKLLKTNVRVNPRDSLGQGLDSAIMLALFFVAGFVADRALGTTPWLMITFTLLGAVGLFYKLKVAYLARMDDLDAERRARAADASPDASLDPGSAQFSDRASDTGAGTAGS